MRAAGGAWAESCPCVPVHPSGDKLQPSSWVSVEPQLHSGAGFFFNAVCCFLPFFFSEGVQNYRSWNVWVGRDLKSPPVPPLPWQGWHWTGFDVLPNTNHSMIPSLPAASPRQGPSAPPQLHHGDSSRDPEHVPVWVGEELGGKSRNCCRRRTDTALV